MLLSSSNDGGDVSDDVLFKIFLFLPADSLIRLRFVCKYWFNLITSNMLNPRFVQMHIDHHTLCYNATTMDKLPTILCTSTTHAIPNHTLYYLNNMNAASSTKNREEEAIEIVYPFKSTSSELKILGSCNGLLCIQVFDSNHTKGISCLWNPSTNEFKQVPIAPIEKPGYDDTVVMYGFGYDQSINDYKLVRLVPISSQLNINKCEVQVYTLGTNSWKSVDKDMPFNLPQHCTKVGLYVNGALHWRNKDNGRICAFAIEDEEFRVLSKPKCSHKMLFGAEVQVLRGCLCIFSSYVDQHEFGFEMWMMMDYGVKGSWTKLFRTAHPKLMRLWDLKPLWICKNGEVLIGNCEDSVPKHLVIYDPNNNEVKSVYSHGIPFNWRNAIVHIGSLVPLKPVTFVDQEQQPKQEEEEEEEEEGDHGSVVACCPSFLALLLCSCCFALMLCIFLPT